MKIRAKASLWRRTARAAALRLFHAVENNGNAKFERNGERWFLREAFSKWKLAAETLVIFDVGANIGEYTARVVAEAKQQQVVASIHAFEPSLVCVKVLRQRFADDANVAITAAAVGESAGRLRLRSGAAGSPWASLVARPNVKDTASEDVLVIRLDDYAHKTGLARIDLLKLDVEGAELAALRGLGDWLDPDRVPLIQFEYGGTTLDARTSLREITSLLESRGYRLAKLFPRALELRRYRAWMDHFNYANYVALSPAWLA